MQTQTQNLLSQIKSNEDIATLQANLKKEELEIGKKHEEWEMQLGYLELFYNELYTNDALRIETAILP